MSFGDDSNGRPRPPGGARDSAVIVLKVLQAATTWLRCRNMLVAKQMDEARHELCRLHAALDELDGQPMNEEHERELEILREEAARLDARMKTLDGRRAEDT